MEFKLRSEIQNNDTLENISAGAHAILIEDGWWIEFTDYGFYVPDGWQGLYTHNILEAIDYLNNLKSLTNN